MSARVGFWARAVRALALAGGALAVSASLPGEAWAAGPASLTVEVYRDLGAPDVSAPRAALERVELVVDLTRSTLRAAQDGRTLADLARSGAAALLESLDERTEVALTVFGHTAGERCTEPERVAEVKGVIIAGQLPVMTSPPLEPPCTSVTAPEVAATEYVATLKSLRMHAADCRIIAVEEADAA